MNELVETYRSAVLERLGREPDAEALLDEVLGWNETDWWGGLNSLLEAGVVERREGEAREDMVRRAVSDGGNGLIEWLRLSIVQRESVSDEEEERRTKAERQRRWHAAKVKEKESQIDWIDDVEGGGR